MKKTLVLTISTALSAAALLAALAHGQGQSQEQSGAGQPEVSQSIHHDVSPPLRDIHTPRLTDVQREKPLHLIPGGPTQNQDDPVVQRSAGPLVGTTDLLNFVGVGDGDYGFNVLFAPPDTVASVGSTQVVQAVNDQYAVFDKTTGAIAVGFPKPENAVWAGFGGGCETNNDGDPIVQYDKANNRWIVTQFSVSTTPYLECVAVSQTSDATGIYNRYAFSYGSTEFPDYPKLGVWPDAYYISFNIFSPNFSGAKVCAYDSAAMRSNAPSATQVCFQLSRKFGGLLPSDLDGSTDPPLGSPNYFLNFGTNKLNLWKFHVDFAMPANSTFSGPTNIPVAAFNTASNVPQPGTATKLDALSDRLMYRLAYRNFGDHESLVANHSVAVGKGKNVVASVRWYELRDPNGTPTVFQQGTLGTTDGIHRWMGSIAMDKVGNIAVGYSAASSTLFPSIRYTGRLSTDTLGTMQTENIIQAGGGSQTGISRWGDYSSMSLDPVDDCTFWYTTEYLKATGSFNWSTRIASFKFPGCM